MDRLLPEDIPARAGLQRLIAEVIHDLGRDVSPSEIAEAAKKDVFDIQNGLARMKKSGRAEQVEHGLWRLGTKTTGNPSIKVIGELPLVNSHEMYDGEVKEGILGMKRDGKLSHYLKYRFQRLSREEVEGGRMIR